MLRISLVAPSEWKTVTDEERFPSRYGLEMKVPTVHQFAKAARALKSDERVPFAFEKRILARLNGRAAVDVSAMFARVMWKAALSCLAISLITGAVVSFSGASSGELLATDLERTVLAPVDVEDTW
jgi:hypothetical protein